MKKFNFRLEKIKRYKEQLEQDKKMKLATEQARLLTERGKLADIIAIRSNCFSSYGVRKTGRINVNQLVITKRYLDKLSRDIKAQNTVIKKTENDVSAAQNNLVEASKEKKKYEKLREKYLNRYNKDALRAEGRELDEFGAREKQFSGSLSI